MKSIYDMGLHEEISMGAGSCVMRVSGGWIYKEWEDNGTGGLDMCNTFVPYNNEFQELK